MICALLLAAGQSRRMGAPKLLLPFGGKTVIGWVMDEVCRSAVGDVILVTGPEAGAFAEALAGQRFRRVVNPQPEAGMLSSVRCGLRALRDECKAVLVVLGDQPAISAGVIDQLIRAFAARDRGLVVPTYQSRRGHPLLLATRFCDELLTRHDDVGLRGLLQAHPEEVLELRVANDGVLRDIDTPADYQRELAHAAAVSPPSL